MSTFTFTIKKESRKYTGYEYEEVYSIKGDYLSVNVKNYTNRGFGCPYNVVSDTRNGSIWSVRVLFKALYSGIDYSLQRKMHDLMVGEQINVDVSD